MATLVTACGGGPAATGSASPSPRPAWEQVLAQIRDDGTVSEQTALEAFAVAFAPLPGVTAPSGPSEPIPDGTTALRWVDGYRSQLTPAQRAIVDAAVTPEAGSTTVREPAPAAAPSTAQAELAAAPISQQANDVLALMGTYLNSESQLLQGAPAYPFEVTINPTQSRPVLASTNLDQVGSTTYCHTIFYPSSFAHGDTVRNATIAHEVFHCIQFRDYQGNLDGPGAPSWLIEGSAEWVGEILFPSPPSFWKDYLLNPSGNLFARSSDAIGFYAHMDERQINPWTRFLRMFASARLSGSVGAFDTALQGASDNFLDNWGSGFAHDSGLGDGWDRTGPGIIELVPDVETIPIANGDHSTSTAGAHSALLQKLQLTADIVHIDASGNVHLHASDGKNLLSAGLHPGDFCTRTDGCPCPPNSVGRPPSDHLNSGLAWLGLGGGDSSSVFAILGISLDDYCKRKPPTGAYPISCQLLTTADISGLLGASPVQMYTPPLHTGDGNACLYHPGSVDWIIPWALVGLTVTPTNAITAVMRQGYTPLSGVGDEAYILVGVADQTAHVWFRSGKTVLWLGVSMGNSGARQTVLALARIVLPRV